MADPPAGLRGAAPRPPAPPTRAAEARQLAEVGAIRRAAGVGHHPALKDNLWEVLHSKEALPSPRVSNSVSPLHRGSPAKLREALEPLPPPAARPAQARGWENHNVHDQMSPQAHNWPMARQRQPEQLLGEANSGLLERRLEISQAELRTELAGRLGSFEQAELRFRDWVQREHEQLQGQVQQLRAALAESQQQQQHQAGAWAAQGQQLGQRLLEVEGSANQALMQAQALAQAAQAASTGGTGEASTSAVQGAVELMRAELGREAASRAAMGSELQSLVTVKIKELQGSMSQMSDKEQEALRSDISQLREQLRRSSGELERRCEEVEHACAQRVANVQESALAAARELWEEHRGVVAECKTSMASLKQILDAKDKIAAQLQSMQQQQREDDKQELLTHLQHGHESLCQRVSYLELAVHDNPGAQLEGGKQVEVQVGRLGVALEKAQASWLKELDLMSKQIHDVQRQVGKLVDNNWDRHPMEAPGFKMASEFAQERPDMHSYVHRLEVQEVEGKLKQQLIEMKVWLSSKIAQSELELRALLQNSWAENSAQVQTEVRRLEQMLSMEGLQARSAADAASRLQEEVARQVQRTEVACADQALRSKSLEAELRDALQGQEKRLLAKLDDLHRGHEQARSQTVTTEAGYQHLEDKLRADLADLCATLRTADSALKEDFQAQVARINAALTAAETANVMSHTKLCIALDTSTAELERRVNEQLGLLQERVTQVEDRRYQEQKLSFRANACKQASALEAEHTVLERGIAGVDTRQQSDELLGRQIEDIIRKVDFLQQEQEDSQRAAEKRGSEVQKDFLSFREQYWQSCMDMQGLQQRMEAMAKTQDGLQARGADVHEELQKQGKAIQDLSCGVGEQQDASKDREQRLLELAKRHNKLQDDVDRMHPVLEAISASMEEQRLRHGSSGQGLQKRLEEMVSMQGDLQGRGAEVEEELGKQSRALQDLIGNVREQREASEARERRLRDLATKHDQLQVDVDKVHLLQALAVGMEEKVDNIEGQVSFLQTRIGEMALAEVVERLSIRMDGGFQALLVRLETEKWLRENVDKVADGVSNSFFRLLDDGFEKLQSRVGRLEHVLTQQWIK